MQKLFNQIQEKEIIDKYNTGISTIRLSKVYNCSVSAINNILKRNKITTRSNSEYRRLYTLDENFFHTINTEEKAYWLGLMYADGYIMKYKNRQHTIGLCVLDKEIIENFLKSINCNMPIHKRIRPNGKIAYYIVLTSKTMFHDLEIHGCVEKKSLILKFPTTIPSNLINHFIRGLFDGDGSVYILNKKWTKTPKKNPTICIKYRIGISITGTKEILEGISKYIDCGIITKEKRCTTNCWYVKTECNSKIKNFYKYVYRNATIYLTRKKNVFENYYKKDVQRL